MTIGESFEILETTYQHGRVAILGELTAYHSAAETLTGPESPLEAGPVYDKWVARRISLAKALEVMERAT